MSSNFLDAGDIQRLDREATLTEQAPRIPPEEPIEQEESKGMALIKALANLLSGELE